MKSDEGQERKELIPCEKCGANDWTFVAAQGAIHDYRCNQCGVLLQTAVTYMPEDLPEQSVLSHSCQLRWNDDPKAMDIQHVQDAIPALKSKDPRDLYLLVKRERKLKVDHCRSEEVEDLKKRLANRPIVILQVA